jgi:uncharacterized membrane protein
MVDQLFRALTIVTALGCGLIGGVFFAFSTFIMRALARLPANEGIAAMQSINIVVINPLFLSVFVGTAVAGVVLVISSLLKWHNSESVYLLAGGVLYVIGTFLVTMIFNVPRNNVLAVLAPTSPEAAGYWAEYVSSWTAWNHVRTVAALAAAASISMSLGD